MNLVKVILDLLFSGDVLGKLSSFLGTSNESTRQAASAAVPAMLSGLAGLADTDEGAQKLASTFNALDLGSAGNLARTLGGDASSLTRKGGSLLASLFGDSIVSNIASSVGKYANLDTSTAKRLLSAIAPTVMSTVAGQWKEEGGGLSALTSLFSGQQKNIASALPSGFSLASIPGLPTAEGALRAVGETARDAAHSAGEAAGYAARRTAGATSEAAGQAVRRTAGAADDAGRSLLMWLAPLAALFLAALGLWYFFGRNPTAPEAARATPPAAPTTPDRRVTLKPELPDVTPPDIKVPDISVVTKDLTGIFNTAMQSLRGISNANAALSALPKLQELSGKIDRIRDTLDKLPVAGQTALGKLVDQQFGPLQAEIARVQALPGLSDKVALELDAMSNKLAGLNLAKVSLDTSNVFNSLTKTLNGLTNTASVEDAVPQLEQLSAKIDNLQRIQAAMSPGGQTMLARIVSAARGPLELLIDKVLTRLGADAALIRPILDTIMTRLAGLSPPARPA